MKRNRALWLVLLLVCTATGAEAAQTFDRVADDINAQYRESRRERQLTLRDIDRRRALLTQKLRDLQGDLAAATDQLAADQERLKDLSRERDALKREITDRLANKEELDTIFMDHARNFLALAEKSPFSAQRPERLETLKSYMAGDRLFGMKDLKTLLDLYFEDMTEAGRKVIFTGSILDRGGNEINGEIIRLGHMAAVHRSSVESGFLTLSPASGRLVMSAEPPYRIRRNLASYFKGRTGDVFTDIAGGTAVQQLARQVTLADQLRSGGVLVVPILLVGLVALGLTAERLLFMGKVRQNTDALMTRVTELVARGDFKGALETTGPHGNRPTGRVLMAGLRHRDETREVIESSISEAILKETPRLERFLGALKVSAAVAPLLGLLGTVTGMINTFQVITAHGTGDPRLMAGGISEAMVTTQVGLAVAIPVMMIAVFLGRRAHTLSQDMEEKGLSLMGALLKVKNNGKTGPRDEPVRG